MNDAFTDPSHSAHQCPLCGGTFADPQVHCRGCPFASACGTVCCPNCGYTYIERSQLVDLFQAVRTRLSRWWLSEGAP